MCIVLTMVGGVEYNNIQYKLYRLEKKSISYKKNIFRNSSPYSQTSALNLNQTFLQLSGVEFSCFLMEFHINLFIRFLTSCNFCELKTTLMIQYLLLVKMSLDNYWRSPGSQETYHLTSSKVELLAVLSSLTGERCPQNLINQRCKTVPFPEVRQCKHNHPFLSKAAPFIFYNKQNI